MDITRETFVSAVVLALLALGVYLILRGVFQWRSHRRSSVGLAPIVAGLGLAASVAFLRSSVALDLLGLRVKDASGIIALVTFVGAVALGIAMGDYVFGRLIPGGIRWMSRRSDSGPKDFLEATVVLGSGVAIAIGAFIVLEIVDPRVAGQVGGSTGLSIEVMAEYELPGGPRDLVLLDASTGYISFESSVKHFEMTATESNTGLELEEVAAPPDVIDPRGLTVTQGFLFVSEQGERQEDTPEGMYSTNGQVIRFRIQDDGSLSDRTVILDEVPIADGLHGINGMAVGPDGKIYLSVGGTSTRFSTEPPNVDWLGSVLRFDISGEGLEVFADGLRNVYDIEFDEQGRLWGVDNDGPTHRDYRAEEVLVINQGENYGYPSEGTHGKYAVRTQAPIWSYTGHDVEGTAGIELAENIGLRPGLFIGARVLTFFRYDEDPDGIFASSDFDFQGNEVVFSRQGYFTVVEAVEAGLLLVGVNGLSLNSNLYLLRVSP